MSSDKIYDCAFYFKCARNKGKILHDNRPNTHVELFGAYQFRRKHKRAARNFSPRLPYRPADQNVFYDTMYRLKINDVWYRPGKAKYVFITKREVIEVLLGIL